MYKCFMWLDLSVHISIFKNSSFTIIFWSKLKSIQVKNSSFYHHILIKTEIDTTLNNLYTYISKMSSRCVTITTNIFKNAFEILKIVVKYIESNFVKVYFIFNNWWKRNFKVDSGLHVLLLEQILMIILGMKGFYALLPITYFD